jgi:rubrerythrin
MQATFSGFYGISLRFNTINGGPVQFRINRRTDKQGVIPIAVEVDYKMFTREDLRDIAIQIERNAETSYRQASKNAKDPKIAQTLLWMADQEKHHAQWFSNMVPFPEIPAQNQALFEMGRELLLGSVQNQTFSLDSAEIAGMQLLPELLDRSIEFEKDTILFYEMLRGFMDDATVLSQLEAIIAEERKHIDTIQDLMRSENITDH